jgi:hypothetical protein
MSKSEDGANLAEALRLVKAAEEYVSPTTVQIVGRVLIALEGEVSDEALAELASAVEEHPQIGDLMLELMDHDEIAFSFTGNHIAIRSTGAKSVEELFAPIRRH